MRLFTIILKSRTKDTKLIYYYKKSYIINTIIKKIYIIIKLI